MKTTDLIPILLYHLKEGDKYGLELVEACKSCSNGKIEIKQPSLYSILKKLEKSHFISSYWKDSEIGGKRHYYKITDNGLAQLETYPPLDELVRLALSATDDEIIDDISTPTSNMDIENSKPKKQTSSFEFTFDSIGENVLSKERLDEEKIIEQTNNATTNDFLYKSQSENKSQIDENSVADNVFEDIKIDDQTYNSTFTEENIMQPEIQDATDNQENLLLDESPISFDINSIKSGEVELPNSVLTINERKVEPVKNDFDIFDAISFADNNEVNQVDEDSEDFTLPSVEDELKTEEFDKKILNEKTNAFNEENTKLFEQDLISFSTDGKISTFAKEKEIKPAKNLQEKVEKEQVAPIPPVQEIKSNNDIEIKFSDYEDFATSPKIINAKHMAKQNLIRHIMSFSLALIIILGTLFISIKTNFTTTYIVYSLIFMLYIVFKFCCFIGNYHKHYLKLIDKNNEYHKKRILISNVIIFVANLILLLIINLALIKEPMFKVNNFGNFLFPILESSYFLFDYLIILICFKQKKIVKI